MRVKVWTLRKNAGVPKRLRLTLHVDELSRNFPLRWITAVVNIQLINLEHFRRRDDQAGHNSPLEVVFLHNFANSERKQHRSVPWFKFGAQEVREYSIQDGRLIKVSHLGKNLLAYPTTGRYLGKDVTVSSSFSMPVGICGTARLMMVKSGKSGNSRAI
jgi:hypothetical protein